MRDLLKALKNNFSDEENLRQKFLNMPPKYGNDEDYADDDGINTLAHLIRSYFKLEGHHMQLNIVTVDILREAHKSGKISASHCPGDRLQ